jgi:potassium-transporting ATPase KdpC subunit
MGEGAVMKTLVIALRATLVTLVLTGILYPLVATGLAQVLFPGKANGSMIRDDKGREVGSSLIAQGFANPAYLAPRPSAAGDAGFDATSSSGSNLGSTSAKLRDRVQKAVAELEHGNPDAPRPVPAELVTASGSGLDPHLSPEAALWQAARIAKARGLSAQRVKAVITDHVEGRDLGFLGEPRVNVLAVNLALDRQFGAPTPLPASGPPPK